MSFKVTERWIEEFKTRKGGWTRVQLGALSIDWPPTEGWKRRAEGQEISEIQRKIFESGKVNYQQNKLL